MANLKTKQQKKHAGQSGYDGNSELRNIDVKIRMSPTEHTNFLAQFLKSSFQKSAVYGREKLLSQSVYVKNNDELVTQRAEELRHLGRLGSNINQIAHRSNSGDVLSKIVEDLKAELEEIKRYKLNLFNKEMRG